LPSYADDPESAEKQHTNGWLVLRRAGVGGCGIKSGLRSEFITGRRRNGLLEFDVANASIRAGAARKSIGF
jgi:hypothetical protein